MRFGGKESSVKWGPLCCWQMRSLGPLFAWRMASLGWREKPGSGKLQRVWGRVGFELTPPLPQSTFFSWKEQEASDQEWGLRPGHILR